jgi:hypothetical protein
VVYKVSEMDWPAQSPDLKPIKHQWDELDGRLRSRPQHPTSLTALATALQEEWAAIPPDTFRHLVESLLGRVQAVIKLKGGPTQYECPRQGNVSQGKLDYDFEQVSGYF